MPKSTKRRSSKVYFGRASMWTFDATGRDLTTLNNVAGNRPDALAEQVNDHYPTQAIESQVTVTENHPLWNKARKSGRIPGDIGGEFQTTKVSWSVGTDRILMWQDTTFSNPFRRIRNYRYGPIHPCGHGLPQIPSVSPSSNATLDAWGAKAVANCSPTNSVADVANLLGETVREGAPKLIGASLWKDKTLELRKFRGFEDAKKRASDEYLNLQFGWAPVVGEIQDVARAIASFDAVWRQYVRDSGRQVRRRFSFPPEYSVSFPAVTQIGRAEHCAPSSTLWQEGPLHQGRVILKEETLTRRWFSGAFVYHLANDGNVFGKMQSEAQMARKTLGLSLTPDTVWNLAPWSWAIDWFTNAGDVITNLTSWALDGQCLRYGYVMEHKSVRRTYAWAGAGTGLRSMGHLPLPIVVTKEVKTRRRANPFGFGITWDGLTPTQVAIATALGISRGLS